MPIEILDKIYIDKEINFCYKAISKDNLWELIFNFK
jgi:hypothetical protein